MLSIDGFDQIRKVSWRNLRPGMGVLGVECFDRYLGLLS